MENPPQPAPAASLDEEDFYFEGSYCVFTEAYHRKRGYCCESGCRHCPFRDAEGNILPEARKA